MIEHERLPSPCPCCGAYSLPATHEAAALLAVADVLVIKALESMGKFLVRGGRERFHVLAGRPFYTAHTVWQPSDDLVTKALRGAWDVVPPLLSMHGCCDLTPEQVTAVLNDYVHDLAVTGTAHEIEELGYRFEHHLGIPMTTSMTVEVAHAH